MNTSACVTFAGIALIGAIGVLGRRSRSRSLEGWAVGGRRLGAATSWFLQAGEMFTTFSFLGMAGLGFTGGSAALYALLYIPLGYVGLYFVGPRLWRLCRDRGHLTQADFIAGAFSSPLLGTLCAILSVVFVLPYLQLQLTGLGLAVQIATDGRVSSSTAILVAFAVTVLYVSWSGIRGVAATSYLKDALLIAVLIVLAVVVPSHFFGGVPGLFHALQTSRPALLSVHSGGPYSAVWFTSSVLASAAGIGFMTLPHMWPELLSASSERVLRRNFTFLPAYALVLVVPMTLGMAAALVLKPGSDSNSALLLLAAHTLPGWLLGVVAVAAATTAMVPAAGILIGISTLVSRNIVRARTPRVQFGVTQGTLVAVAGAAALLAVARPDLIANLLLLTYSGLDQLIPCLIIALLGRRLGARWVLAGLAAGVATVILFTPPFGPLHPGPYNAGLIGLVPNLLLCLTGLLLPTVRRAANRPAPTVEGMSMTNRETPVQRSVAGAAPAADRPVSGQPAPGQTASERPESGRNGSITRPVVTLIATCLALFLGQVDTTAVNLALPSIHRELAGDLSGLQWVVDAYNVAFAALLLTGGTLGDRYGRRRLFRIGIAIFALGSAACALAPTLAVLLGGRVLQGIGAGMMLPQSLAILATAFPERRERNRAMAAWSVVAGAGLAAGPTLGGVAVQVFGWHSIFWINVPLGVAALLLTLRHVPESRNPHARTLDPAGQALAIVALGLLTFIAVDGHSLGWYSPRTLVCAAVCLAAFAGFILAERHHPTPMIPLRLLRRGQLPVASIVAICMTFGMYGLFVLISLAFQQERGLSALAAGVQMLPLPVVFTLLSPSVGSLVTRYGPRLPMTAGMTLMGAGMLMYGLIGPDANLWVTEAAFVIVGIGLALNTGPVVGVAVSAVAPELAGLASGIANLARMSGATLGVAVQGSVLAVVGRGAGHGPDFVSGLRAAVYVGCVVEFVGALVAFRYVARPRAGTPPAGPDAEPGTAASEAAAPHAARPAAERRTPQDSPLAGAERN